MSIIPMNLQILGEKKTFARMTISLDHKIFESIKCLMM